jgi:hypothetical protein
MRIKGKESPRESKAYNGYEDKGEGESKRIQSL